MRRRQRQPKDEDGSEAEWQLPDTHEVLEHPLVREAFSDPRYRHLQNFGNFEDLEPEQAGYDRAMTLQALAAVYSIRSAEKTSSALSRATWALVAATGALVLVTVALVVVTVLNA